MDISDVTGIVATKLRNHHNARVAYDTVLRMLPNITPEISRKLRFVSGDDC